MTGIRHSLFSTRFFASFYITSLEFPFLFSGNPYHSKYYPVERCWGVLEQHWNGDILDELNTVVRCAQTMIYNGKSPLVKIVDKIYVTGVRLSKALMAEVESQLARFDALGRWFVDIIWKRPLIS